jgi:ribose transport system ATP-binding protein
MKGIYKSFGADNVLSGVNFEVSDGETVALLGESGAGKSALIAVLSGAETADRGEITIDGVPVRFRSPTDAAKAGIFTVYQEPEPIIGLTVYEYIFLGREITKYGVLDNKSMKSEAGRILWEIRAGIGPEATLGGLNEDDRQTVDMCRAFLSGASVIVLDSAVTSTGEPVFEILSRLKRNGVGVVFASSNLRDALRVCSRIVILRDGTVVGEYNRDQADAETLRGYMRGVDISFPKRERFVSRYCVLKVSCAEYSFCVNRGEILGIIGSEFSERYMPAVGLGKKFSGKVYLRGKGVRVKNPAAAMKLGIAFAPRCRRKNGIFPDMNIMDNISMMTWRFSGARGFINRRGQELVFETQSKRLRIKAGYRYNPISAISGGDQQKSVLARLLLFTPQVLIMDNPTQDMCTEDREDIYGLIYCLADKGGSIIVISDDRAEISRLCDRVLVMKDGRIIAELTGERRILDVLNGEVRETL